jgi:phosphomannomutase
MAVKLAFGTAGIRAPLGEGDDQLNLRTVRVVAHALAKYALEVVPEARARGICVGFDGRTSSDVFAQEVTRVALAHGLRVRAFDEPIPTPVLAFATRQHRAALGVMITASHNPPSDNGIKVYFEGGAQILAPHDAAIAQRIGAQIESASIPRAELEEARAAGQLSALGASELEAYLAAVLAVAPHQSALPLPRLAYSALCGVGGAITHRLLSAIGADDVVEVQSQALPRADFGGLRSPNPEHSEALQALLALAKSQGAELAACHDPDADRLAVAVRATDGQMRVLSGDEVGALLGDYMLSMEPAPSRALVVSTLVSADLMREIARARGVRFEQTLTGFKWIAERARDITHKTGEHYVFGYEEALGYAFGRLGDDKDGIAALYVLLELARQLRSKGQTLLDRLALLARAHGLFATRQVTINAAGEQGKARMAEIMRTLRGTAPESWLGSGAGLEDFANGMPRADLLVFRAASSRVCVRPSGTEPKLKLYLQVREHVAPHEELSAAEQRVQQGLAALEQRTRTLIGPLPSPLGEG